MMFHTGATTASAAVPSGPWYWPTMAVSTMEYTDVIEGRRQVFEVHGSDAAVQ